MSDPRQTLSNTTLAGLPHSVPYARAGALRARSTNTPLDQNRRYRSNPSSGAWFEESQDPTIEGELIILYLREFGERVGLLYVAVNAGGASLEWKPARVYNQIINGRTGNPF
jgi:hypothetical protein